MRFNNTHLTGNREVLGSIPTRGSSFFIHLLWYCSKEQLAKDLALFSININDMRILKNLLALDHIFSDLQCLGYHLSERWHCT